MSGLDGRLREVVAQGGGCLQEVSLLAIWLTEEPIEILVRWSLKRGGRLQEVSLLAIWLTEEWLGGRLRVVVAQGGSTGRMKVLKMRITCKRKCDRNVCELWFTECKLYRLQSWNNN